MSEATQASFVSDATPGSSRNAKPGWRGRVKPSIDLDMVRLCRTNLDIRFQLIQEDTLQTESQRKIYSTVRDMLRAPPETAWGTTHPDWDEIARIEGLIALLLSGAALRHEIDRRLRELAKESLVDADTLRSEYETLLKLCGEDANSAANENLLRTFLLRVLEAIHWQAKKKYLARPIRKKATKNTLLCLLIAFAFLVVPYVVLNIDFGPEPPSSDTNAPWAMASVAETTGRASQSDLAPSQDATAAAVKRAVDAPAASSGAGAKGGISKWWSLFSLWTALSSGLLGAFFSRLMSVESQWTDMKLDDVLLQREWSYSLLRAGVGLCGALVVYFFLRSGIVEGALFPKFSDIAIQFVQHPANSVPMTFVMPSKDLALLTFWCFIAGFSEKLVPTMLTSSERQLTDATTSMK